MNAYKTKKNQITSAQRQTMEKEISKQIAESMRILEFDINAVVLYALRKEFGFGKERLERFQRNFREILSDLINKYELGEEDKAWLCKQKLKDIGVDLDEFIEKPIFGYEIEGEKNDKNY